MWFSEYNIQIILFDIKSVFSLCTVSKQTIFWITQWIMLYYSFYKTNRLACT
jgi:hypothetical protein